MVRTKEEKERRAANYKNAVNYLEYRCIQIDYHRSLFERATEDICNMFISADRNEEVETFVERMSPILKLWAMFGRSIFDDAKRINGLPTEKELNNASLAYSIEKSLFGMVPLKEDTKYILDPSHRFYIDKSVFSKHEINLIGDSIAFYLSINIITELETQKYATDVSKFICISK